MWICPKCNREFKNKNQDHTCGVFTVENVFGSFTEAFLLFEKLKEIITHFGEVKITPVKNAIMFSVQTNFLVLKPHRNYLAVEFTSIKNHNEFPVEKCVKITKTKYFHLLKIDSMEDIDEQLKNWLKEAYQSDLSL